ncbi:hypothetical protein FR483_N146R [Paramecium bursaria Chlorella virus FR483]|uniref:Uncharacterized protein N146R n=1 Tax=Paramecium bursaria Chlorella virus FR483 TaxID=399781 RepID=A7J6K0_PBCVF|nr:hypothetical protein FR483_N146R [Paramecium bursaria Chlorella virus FR483]ABT15431.1 hypothetical protein FR483_N146R [Paramecium bursaria Chlorella virus FR483]
MTICKHPECKKNALYNTGGSKAKWCKEHKTLEMINVKNKRCPCGKNPIYNLPGENIGICCKDCKTDEMVDVKNKKCPCGKQPVYNLPGELAGVYCKDCKTDEMVDVKNKKCACRKRPVYNLPGELTGICCSECKTPGMFDVVSKRCPCGKQPMFNIPGESIGICCKECKTSEMINVRGKRCPGYNGEKCPVGYRLVSGCKYCLSCDPDDSRRDKFKKYENAFFKYVKGKIDVKRREFVVKYDPQETSKKWARMDGIVFGNGIIVCLEVDENGHEIYECDKTRMHMVTAELLKKYPHTDVCWVRVNPTTKHKNPWGVAAKRVRAERFDAVIKAVNNVLKNKTTDIIYIGFDV